MALSSLSLSSACLAISLADERGTLRLEERASRFGDTFVAICDDRGTIEVSDTRDEAEARIDDLRQRREVAA